LDAKRDEIISVGMVEMRKCRINPEQTHIFLCGNPTMIEQTEGILTGYGYDPGSHKNPGTLHREKYW
ncbi:MAG: hypothetical protein HQL50_12220, partial [Magnetococcales bacterium]|nr:hypothetical protein [Magnetococcales bacterium]